MLTNSSVWRRKTKSIILKNSKKRFLIVGLILSMIVASGCLQKLPEEQNKGQVQSSEPSPDISIDLSIKGIPILNQSVELLATVKENSGNEYPNQTIQIFLPEGFILLDGNLIWKGKLHSGETIKLNATIKAVKKGEWQIEGIIGPIFENKDFLYIRTDENSGDVSPLPFDYPDPTKRKGHFQSGV